MTDTLSQPAAETAAQPEFRPIACDPEGVVDDSCAGKAVECFDCLVETCALHLRAHGEERLCGPCSISRAAADLYAATAAIQADLRDAGFLNLETERLVTAALAKARGQVPA